jgi:hypothetical protein
MLRSLDVQLHYVVAVLITTVATVATVRHLPYAATTGVADVLVNNKDGDNIPPMRISTL